MASTSKCPYCGSTVSSDQAVCPGCGAPNENYVADTEKKVFLPTTIQELREYCAERGMPLLRMRFFIGEDFREPRAFGIYRDGDEFVVYKNKSDGSRAIRYRGPDEAKAVNEIFLKLLDECHARGIYPDGKPQPGAKPQQSRRKGRNKLLFLFIAVYLVMLLSSTLLNSCAHRNDGYYAQNNIIYYNYGGDWYYNDSSYSDAWFAIDQGPSGDLEDAYLGSDFDSDWGGTAFEDSDTYADLQDSSSSSSSDYDSWDSGDTDFDSDW